MCFWGRAGGIFDAHLSALRAQPRRSASRSVGCLEDRRVGAGEATDVVHDEGHVAVPRTRAAGDIGVRGQSQEGGEHGEAVHRLQLGRCRGEHLDLAGREIVRRASALRRLLPQEGRPLRVLRRGRDLARYEGGNEETFATQTLCASEIYNVAM